MSRTTPEEDLRPYEEAVARARKALQEAELQRRQMLYVAIRNHRLFALCTWSPHEGVNSHNCVYSYVGGIAGVMLKAEPGDHVRYVRRLALGPSNRSGSVISFDGGSAYFVCGRLIASVWVKEVSDLALGRPLDTVGLRVPVIEALQQYLSSGDVLRDRIRSLLAAALAK